MKAKKDTKFPIIDLVGGQNGDHSNSKYSFASCLEEEKKCVFAQTLGIPLPDQSTNVYENT